MPEAAAPVRPEPEPPRCFAISITPFVREGGVDEEALRRHLRRLTAAGIGVYVGGGGSGEGYTLSAAEVRRIQEIAVDEVKGAGQVRAMGIEPRTASEMSGFLAGAQAAGINAAQVYSLDQGHGHRPTPAELERYLVEVLSNTGIECIISTHQSVGYRIPVDLLESLATRFDHMTGVNCSQPDLAYLTDVVDALSGRCHVHVGGPGQALAALSLGARGFLSSEANLAPKLCASVGDAFDAGPAQPMVDRAGTVLRLSQLLYGHGGIRATKAILERCGWAAGSPRPPRLSLPAAEVDGLVAAIAALGIDELGPLIP